MTKDEAKAAVMRLMRAECTCGIPGVKEPCFACEMSAGLDVLAQAAANAALEIERNTIIVQEANHDEGQYEEDADTLGMLEEIAKLQDSVVIYLHDGQTALEVWQHKGPGMEFRYQKQGRITPCHEENITRAEAEALLGKGQ